MSGTGGSDRPRWVLAVACATILLDALDLSITQVALPQIRADLQVPEVLAPWVVNAYVLTYGGLLLFGGRAADLVGRRPVLVTGLVLFGTGSLVCGFSPHIGLLIAGRAVQGVGAALTVPAAVALIAATFPQGPPRERAMGVFAAFAGAGFSLGLVLGGALTGTFGWPAIFLVKVPVVVLVVVAAVRAVPPGAGAAAGPGSWDVPGAVSGTVGLLLVVFAVTAASSPTPGPGVTVGAAVTGLALLACFLLVERRSTAPLLPLRLFGNRVVAAADLASLTVLAAPFGVAYLTSTYLQTVQGWSPLRTGLGLLPGAVLSAVVSRWVAPRLIARLGLRASGAVGLVVVAAGFAGLALVRPEPSYVAVVLPATVVCFGLGMGLTYPVFTVAAVTDVDEHSQGLAAGVQNTALQVGGGLGLAVVGAVVAALAGTGDLAALRGGALAGSALPLIGAVLTVALLKPAAGPRPARAHDEETTSPR